MTENIVYSFKYDWDGLFIPSSGGNKPLKPD